MGPLLGVLGGLLGGFGGGMAESRENMNDSISRQNQTQANVYNTQQQSILNLLQQAERASLDRADLGMKAPDTRTSQLIRGSLLQNMQPFTVQPNSSRVKVPTVSGGLTPAALSSMARSGGGELQRQALLALLTKSDIPAQQDYSKGMLKAPPMAALKKPGMLETIAGVGAPILGGLGAIMGARGGGRGGGQQMNLGIGAF